MSASLAGSVDDLGRLRRRQRETVAIAASVIAPLIALVGVMVGSTMVDLAIAVGTAAMLIPVLVWRLPIRALVGLMIAATLVEQFPIVGDGTDKIPLFSSLSTLGFGGVYLLPFELLLAVFALIWILKAGAERRLRLPRSPLSAAFAVLIPLVVFAEVRGLGSGGSLNYSLWELRPWIYLSIVYVLASQLITRRAGLQLVLWTFVLGTGFKSLQGVYEFIKIRNVQPRPESILAHEEAFFFGVFILLVAAFWLFGQRGRLRAVATGFLPFVIAADLTNGRRNAWAILIPALLALAVVGFVRLPERRHVLTQVMLGVFAFSLVYLPLFWSSQSTLAQPARAVRSAINPSERDQQSNQYRTLEDANLQLNIKRSPVVGLGFGVPIDYAIPIVNLSNIDPLIQYVPHDGILYVWMRLGVIGMLAFWGLIAAAFILAGKVLRHPDPRLALFGALAICCLIAYLVQAHNDLGLFWFRIAIFMGCILGGLEAITRMRPAEAAALALGTP